jgi:hypothetical protein
MKSMRTRVVLGKQLLRKPRENSLQLAELLAKVQAEGGFQDYCAEIGIRKRRAYYLTELMLAVERGRLSKQDIIAIGWTKCQIILAADVPPNQMGRTVQYARGHTVKELRQRLKLDAVDDRRTMTLRVTSYEESRLRALLRDLRLGLARHQSGYHGAR